MRSYRELSGIKSFEDRYRYLRIGQRLGDETFGHRRFLNQEFYKSPRWLEARAEVIYRDEGCDLGVLDRQLDKGVIVHHMNPITLDMIENDSYALYDPDNLITCSLMTHNAIHYGDESLLVIVPPERRPNDTIPWR